MRHLENSVALVFLLMTLKKHLPWVRETYRSTSEHFSVWVSGENLLEVCFGHPNNKIRRKKDKMNQNRYLYIGTLGRTEIGSCRYSTFSAQGTVYIHIICRFDYFIFIFIALLMALLSLLLLLLLLLSSSSSLLFWLIFDRCVLFVFKAFKNCFEVTYMPIKPILNVYTSANIYLLKCNNRNTRKRCEICSKLTIKTPERRPWRCSGVFINFEHIPHLFLVFL